MREEKREIDKIVRKKKVVSKEEETQTEYCK